MAFRVKKADVDPPEEPHPARGSSAAPAIRWEIWDVNDSGHDDPNWWDGLEWEIWAPQTSDETDEGNAHNDENAKNDENVLKAKCKNITCDQLPSSLHSLSTSLKLPAISHISLQHAQNRSLIFNTFIFISRVCAASGKFFSCRYMSWSTP